MYVCEGFDVKAFMPIYAAFTAAGIIPAVVGTRQKTKGSDGMLHKGHFTLETSRSTHFDAIIVCECCRALSLPAFARPCHCPLFSPAFPVH